MSTLILLPLALAVSSGINTFVPLIFQRLGVYGQRAKTISMIGLICTLAFGGLASNLFLVDFPWSGNTLVGYALSLAIAFWVAKRLSTLSHETPVLGKVRECNRTTITRATSLCAGVSFAIVDSTVHIRSYPLLHLTLGLFALGFFALAAFPEPVAYGDGHVDRAPMAPLSLRPARLGKTLALDAGFLVLASVVMIIGARQFSQPEKRAALLLSPSTAKRSIALIKSAIKRLPGASLPSAINYEKIHNRSQCDGLGPDFHCSTHTAALSTYQAPHTVVMITIDAFRCDLESDASACPSLTRLFREGVGRLDARAVSPATSASIRSMFGYVAGSHRESRLGLGVFKALRHSGFSTHAILTHSNLVSKIDLHASFNSVDTALIPIAKRANGITSAAVAEKLTRKLAKALHSDNKTFLWAHLYDCHAPYVRSSASPFSLSKKKAYAAEMARTDDAIRHIMKTLETVKDNRVMLVVTADHGEEFWEHGGSEHGTALYEESVRIPFIVWRSGDDHRGGLDPRLPRSSNEFGAYLLSAAMGQPWQAANFSLLWAKPSLDAQVAIVWNEWKYIWHIDLAFGELYQLRSDPAESVNLAHIRTDITQKLHVAVSKLALSNARP